MENKEEKPKLSKEEIQKKVKMARDSRMLIKQRLQWSANYQKEIENMEEDKKKEKPTVITAQVYNPVRKVSDSIVHNTQRMQWAADYKKQEEAEHNRAKDEVKEPENINEMIEQVDDMLNQNQVRK